MDERMNVYANASWRAVLLMAFLAALVQGQDVQVLWSRGHASKEQQTNRYIDAVARLPGANSIYLGVSEFRKVDVGQEIALAIWACNSNGEVVQKTTILTEATQDRYPSPGIIAALAALPNNHRVMIARTDGIHQKIVRIDGQGEIVFVRPIEGGRIDFPVMTQIVVDKNKTVWLAGKFGSKAALLKLSDRGDVAQRFSYRFGEYNVARDVTLLANGDFILCGQSWSSEFQGMVWIAKVNAAGNVLAKDQIEIGRPPNPWGCSVATSSSGEIALLYRTSLTSEIQLKIRVYDGGLQLRADNTVLDKPSPHRPFRIASSKGRFVVSAVDATYDLQIHWINSNGQSVGKKSLGKSMLGSIDLLAVDDGVITVWPYNAEDSRLSKLTKLRLDDPTGQ